MKDWHSSSHPQSLQGFHFQTTWKPQESLIWLFYYSLPILHDILSKGYLLQYACFVEAIVLFCSDSNADEDIALNSYFRILYICAHIIVQVYDSLYAFTLAPQCVKDLGPLWVYSCSHMKKLMVLFFDFPWNSEYWNANSGWYQCHSKPFNTWLIKLLIPKC